MSQPDILSSYKSVDRRLLSFSGKKNGVRLGGGGGVKVGGGGGECVCVCVGWGGWVVRVAQY